MIRKLIFPCFILIFITVNPLFPQNQNPSDSSTAVVTGGHDELSEIEKRFKSIDETVVYLKNKNVDISDINAMYSDAENLFKELKYNAEIKDYYMTLKFLTEKLSVIEEKSSQRVTFARRMNVIYILMVVMGLSIVVIMGGYSIYMYLRRK